MTIKVVYIASENKWFAHPESESRSRDFRLLFVCFSGEKARRVIGEEGREYESAPSPHCC
jgi:hypothetical protein